MVDGDIRGYLAKQGGLESALAGAGCNADKNNDVSANAEEVNESGTEGGHKRDTFTATPGRKNAGLCDGDVAAVTGG